MMRKIIIALILFPYLVLSQMTDSVVTKFSTIGNGLTNYSSIDTGLLVSDYYNFTGYQKDNFDIISMGNMGDVQRRLTYSPITSFSPSLGIDGYFKNSISLNGVPFYKTLAPVGGIRFLTGYNSGQMFGAFFTVNPTKRLNVFIDYQRINARGNYLNQENLDDRLQVSTSYATKDDFYSFYAVGTWQKYANIEYGGIKNPEEFSTNEFSNRELLAISLYESTSKARSTDLLISQAVKILATDSIDGLKFFYDFSFKDQFVSFQSSDSIFTSQAIFDQAPIQDSIRLQTVDNLAGLQFLYKNQQIKSGVLYTYFKYGNAYQNFSSNALGLAAEASGKLFGFGYRADFKTYFTNQYAGTYQLKVDAFYQLKKIEGLQLAANFENGLVEPGLFTAHYISNNFLWNNDFNRVFDTKLSVSARFRKYNLSMGLEQTQNLIYFDQHANPAQESGLIGYYYAELGAEFKLARNLFLDNRIRWQTVNNEAVVRIPDFNLRHTLYYNVNAFKNVLHAQLGLELRYFSSFTSQAYMPATTSMYLQDDVQIGNFPYVNFFIDFKIQELVFFVKAENVTQGLVDYNYYAAPNYPLADFALRIGAKWRFFN